MIESASEKKKKCVRKLDGIAHWLADKARSWGIEITAWYACAARQLEMAMSQNAPTYVSQLACRVRKACKVCGDLRTACDIRHLSAAFSIYEDAWGEGILGKLVEPFFNRLCAEEQEVTGGIEWSTLAKRAFLFQCTSAAIARGGTMALGTLRQGW